MWFAGCGTSSCQYGCCSKPDTGYRTTDALVSRGVHQPLFPAFISESILSVSRFGAGMEMRKTENSEEDIEDTTTENIQAPDVESPVGNSSPLSAVASLEEIDKETKI